MVEYKATLNLPRTGFEMRAGLAAKEPRLLQQWHEQDLWGAICAARAGAPRFVLHDGPPYANGSLHHGHILNKILKDIVVKDRTMSGFAVPYVPGWDCHGLPIEVQVDKELGAKKATMSKADIRAACRAYARRFVDLQRDQFRRLGVLGRWERPYLTMDPAYEAATLRELAAVVRAGLLYKGLRPVNWCVTHQTALAEAEVEYESHRSPSAYVAFALLPDARLPQPSDVVVWTTTPWTLPANVAVAVHPEMEYVAYALGGRHRLVARALLTPFLEAIGAPPADEALIAARFTGRELAHLRYQHPFLPRQGEVLCGDHVSAEAGTGCVHTAPGHGADDFEMGRRCGLEVLSPVDGRGVLTEAAGPFAGRAVFAANPEILAALAASGALLSPPDAQIAHRYAHCWRCHRPIILRATEQWFVALDRPFAGGPSLRARALAALEAVSWVPGWGIERMRGMLRGRPDWCLSRQRNWGVPIAVAYCERCQTPLLDADAMLAVADVFEREGATAWWSRPLEALMGQRACAQCGHEAFRKEEDILDVWFDSGVSFAAVIERQGLGQPQGPPVDLYLEGSDQHRGWFHAALLCSLATRERPPFRALLTHGFVVDGSGKKISKSKGNYLDPFVAIDRDGAELLRLWAASEDYSDDIRLSQEILTRLTDSYRKVRNTLRFLLGNLHDFAPQRDRLEAAQLHELDAYAVVLSCGVATRVREAYAAYNFHSALQALVEWCNVELSAFYLDVLKDRLYASAAHSAARRSAQTALFHVARDLLRLLAPIFCFTAEEAWQHLPRLPTDPHSVHLAAYPGLDEPPEEGRLRAEAQARIEPLLPAYGALRELRRQVNGALEEARRGRQVGSSVEAAVALHNGAEALRPLQHFSPAALAEALIVSDVARQADDAAAPLRIEVRRAAGTKCARCWLLRPEVGQDAAHPELCGRCVEAMTT